MNESNFPSFSRALIVLPVWGELLLSGSKPWELRSSKTNIRGRIGIIFSGSGFIFGSINLVDSLPPIDPETFDQHFLKHRVPFSEKSIREKYRFPWLMESQIRFRKPIPYIHPKGAVIWVNDPLRINS